MEPTLPRVVTVILNTNRRDDTLACLESLHLDGYANHHIIVLDNASEDGSAAAIRTHFPAVQVIPLTRNLGYAGNNNVGIAAALRQNPEWIFILNEDTVLAPDCLFKLVDEAQSDPQIGIAGPLVYHFDEPDIIQSAGGLLGPTWQSQHLAQNEHDDRCLAETREVEWISGCAILVRRAVIDQIGALDERFYYYWEETEWCMRAYRQGWRIVNVPTARLWHKGVQRHYEPSPTVTYYNTRNRLLFMRKHRAPLRAWLAAWSEIGRTVASWSLRPKWRNRRPHRDAVWQGTRDFFAQRWGMRP